MNRYKKWILLLLAVLMSFSMITPCFADSDHARTVIGANLDQEQIAQVYDLFGVDRDYARELFVTNQEERQYLQGLVSDSVIGTRSISCVFVEIYPEGAGMNVTTENITWCTPEMYINALATAGITDARIMVAAPFPVSGTAALTGVYKAYEDITGTRLDETAKAVGTQELTVTGALAEELGESDTTAIINDLKDILGETASLTDEQLLGQIDMVAQQYNVRLTEGQKRQLLNLVRSLEKLDIGTWKERAESVQNTIQKVGEAKNKLVSFIEKVRVFIEDVENFIDKVRSWF